MTSSPQFLHARPAQQRSLWQGCGHPLGGYRAFPDAWLPQDLFSLFARVAQEHSQRVAVVTDRRQTTYQQLYLNALALAAKLRSVPTPPGTQQIVSLLLRNGEEMITSMLGVAAAGFIYSPMDPEAPDDHLRDLLHESGVDVVVTTSPWMSRLAGIFSGEIILLDKLPDSSDGDQLDWRATETCYSYILHTSGSTGRPKAVIHTRRSQLCDIRNWTNEAKVSCHDRFVLLTGHTQLGNQIIHTALLNGASLYPINLFMGRTDPLDDWIASQGITILRCTTTFFRQYCHLLTRPDSHSQLRLVRLGGEPVYSSDYAQYVSLFPERCLFSNAYATTEAGTITCMLYDKSAQVTDTLLPAGYPVEGVELVPDTARDMDTDQFHLTIRSDALCAGYWQRGQLSQMDTHATDSSRHYRTGDLGRYTQEGCLVHLGRLDRQIKVRGYRVEPAELEIALTQMQGVREAAVGLCSGILTGWVTSVPGAQINHTLICAYLAARFPSHMIPDRVHVLQALPRNRSGKTDYKALASRHAGQTDPAPMVPVADLDGAVLQIWRDVIGRPALGLDSPFVESGGNSLFAMQIVSRLETIGYPSVSIMTLFNAATVRALVRQLAERDSGMADGTGQTGCDHAPLQKCVPDRHIPLSAYQDQIRMQADRLGEDRAVDFRIPLVLKLVGPLDRALLERTLQEIVSRHMSLRFSLIEDAGKYGQIATPGTVPPVECEVLDSYAANETDRLEACLLERLRSKLEPTRDGPVSFKLYRGRESTYLLCIFQHLFFDGWSVNLFIREFARIYQAVEAGALDSLPFPSGGYVEFVQARAAWLSSIACMHSEAFWKSRLAGAHGKIPFPFLQSGSDSDSAPTPERKLIHDVEISPQLHAALGTVAAHHGTTLFTVLLSAYFTLLYRYSAHYDIVVSVPCANRIRREEEDVIGCFVNTLPYRADLKNDPLFRDLLRQIHTYGLEALSHQALPFSQIVQRACPELLQGMPPSQGFAFSYQQDYVDVIGCGPLRLERFPWHPEPAFADLTLVIRKGVHGTVARFVSTNRRFDLPALSTMARHYLELLNGITIDADQRLTELPCLSEVDRLVLHRKAGLEVEASSARGSALGRLRHLSNLSTPQFAAWLEHELNYPDPVSNTVFEMAIDGPLDLDRFVSALRQVLDENDALRMIIEKVAGVPRYRIEARSTAVIDLLDFTNFEGSENGYRKWAETDSREPFQPDAPLIRMAIVKCGPQRHFWYVRQHQTITDAYASSLLIKRVTSLYNAKAHGLTNMRMPEHAADAPGVTGGHCVSYPQRKGLWASSESDARATAYWEQKLSAPHTALRLYARRPTALRMTHRSSIELGADRCSALSSALSAYRWMRPVNEGSFLLALLILQLHALGSRDHFRIAMPYHGRESDADRGTLGLFMRLMILDITIHATDTLADLVNRIGREILSSVRHSSLPHLFDQRAAEVDAYFNYNNHVFAGDLSECTSRFAHLVTGHEAYTLGLHVEAPVNTAQLSLHFDFNGQSFTPGQIETFVQQYAHLLDTLIVDPVRPVAGIPFFPGHTTLALARRFNCYPPFPQEQASLIQLFEDAVARAPAAIALEDGTTRKTYAEFNRICNRLARRIQQEMRATSAALIAVASGRTWHTVAAFLAVLKSGHTCILLDPDSAPRRNATILSDCRPALFLGTSGNTLTIGDVWPCPSFDLEGLIGDQCAADESNLSLRLSPEAIAYVIYTSGTTGTPKGAMIQHRGIANLTQHLRQSLALGQQNRVLQAAPVSFDAFLFEIILSLGSGAALVIPPESARLPGAELATFLARQSVDTLVMTPSALQQLGKHPLLSVRTVCTVGERCSAALASRFTGTVRFFNLYGPSETSIMATGAHLTLADSEPHIGRPIHGAQVYVLNACKNPLPAGITGELYIGGAGVGAGYRNLPEENVRAFLDDPFHPDPGGRLYRTGDLGYQDDQGNLHYVGRCDLQVKIRGFRIEPGEVEAAISRMPGVRECVVLARETADGNELVAYLVPEGGRELDTGTLRAGLRDVLPEYMLPARYISLLSLPLNRNGKVDRKALPEPEGTRPVSCGPYAEPQTALQRELCDMWQSVLSLERVGIDDDFVLLGGNSILALELAGRMSALGRTVHARDVYRHPTIRQLTDLPDTTDTISQRVVVHLQEKGSKPPLFFMPPAISKPEKFMPLAFHLGTDRPFLFLHNPEQAGVMGLPPSIEAIAGFYVSTIKSIQPHGPYYIAGTCLGGIIAFEVARQFHARGDAVGALMIVDTLFPPRSQTSGLSSPARKGMAYFLGRVVSNLQRGRLFKVIKRRIQLKYVFPNMAGGAMLQMIHAANTVARSRYVAQPYLGRISLIQSREGARTGNADGWRVLAAGGLDVHEVPCTHPQILEEPHIEQVASALNSIMSGS